VRAVALISIACLLGWILIEARAPDILFHVRVQRTSAREALTLYWLLASGAAVVVLEVRRRRAQILVLAAATLLALGAAEVALRLWHPGGAFLAKRYLYSPTLHHVLPPSAIMVGRMVDAEPLGARVVTNEDGLRAGYSREEFLARRRRIAFLGDSFTHGLGVTREAAAPAVVERLLRERLGDQEIAVLNTGQISYSPVLEEILFRDVVAAYRPELVFLILDATDFGDDFAYSRGAERRDGRLYFPPYPEGGLTLLDHLALYERAYPTSERWYLRLTRPIAGALKSTDPPWDPLRAVIGDDDDRFFIFKRPPSETRPFFEETLGHVEDIAAAVRRAGGVFVLVLNPRFQLWDPEGCPKNWEHRRYSVHDPYTGEYLRFFEEARARVDFDIVNLLPALRAHKDAGLVFKTDPHWNKNGHAVVGQALFEYIMDKRLLPGTETKP
jgi:hypothetical protein